MNPDLSLSLLLQAFAQNVLSKADVIQATGDAVCVFKELQCLTPRGRYGTDSHTHAHTMRTGTPTHWDPDTTISCRRLDRRL